MILYLYPITYSRFLHFYRISVQVIEVSFYRRRNNPAVHGQFRRVHEYRVSLPHRAQLQPTHDRVMKELIQSLIGQPRDVASGCNNSLQLGTARPPFNHRTQQQHQQQSWADSGRWMSTPPPDVVAVPATLGQGMAGMVINDPRYALLSQWGVNLDLVPPPLPSRCITTNDVLESVEYVRALNSRLSAMAQARSASSSMTPVNQLEEIPLLPNNDIMIESTQNSEIVPGLHLLCEATVAATDSGVQQSDRNGSPTPMRCTSSNRNNQRKNSSLPSPRVVVQIDSPGEWDILCGKYCWFSSCASNGGERNQRVSLRTGTFILTSTFFYTRTWGTKQ